MPTISPRHSLVGGSQSPHLFHWCSDSPGLNTALQLPEARALPVGNCRLCERSRLCLPWLTNRSRRVVASLRPVLILLLVSGYMSQYIVSCILPLSSGAQSRGSDLRSMPKKTALLIVSFFVCLPLDRQRLQGFHFATCLFRLPVCFPGQLQVNEQSGANSFGRLREVSPRAGTAAPPHL